MEDIRTANTTPTVLPKALKGNGTLFIQNTQNLPYGENFNFVIIKDLRGLRVILDRLLDLLLQ